MTCLRMLAVGEFKILEGDGLTDVRRSDRRRRRCKRTNTAHHAPAVLCFRCGKSDYLRAVGPSGFQ